MGQAMGACVQVASVIDVKLGQGIVIEVNGNIRAAFTVERTVHAIHNTYIHWDGPLGEDLVGLVVTCPWHGWQYDVTTGVCVANPAAKVERDEVKVDGTGVKILV
jgi:nitrite reductase (NADH) small subunit